jgi:hypothetical protein
MQTFVRTLRAPMLLPGGVVLAVGIASFMRAPLLPEIGRDLGIGLRTSRP